MVTSERLIGINIGFAVAGALLAGWLVLSELFREPTCPGLAGIPACYVVLGGYLVALAGAWTGGTKAGSVALVAGAGVVTAVGAWFSLNQLSGAIDCPTLEGLPMCFVSLLTGASMIAIDLLRRRLTPAS